MALAVAIPTILKGSLRIAQILWEKGTIPQNVTEEAGTFDCVNLWMTIEIVVHCGLVSTVVTKGQQ